MKDFAPLAGVPVRGAKLVLFAPRAMLESRGLPRQIHFGGAKPARFTRQIGALFDELVRNVLSCQLSAISPSTSGCWMLVIKERALTMHGR
jgi:hypothetical protein